VAAHLECMAGEKIKKGASNLVRALERELREGMGAAAWPDLEARRGGE